MSGRKDQGIKKKRTDSGFSRREFIRLTGLAGVGAALPSCHFSEKIPPPSDYRNVIIIASGFGGAVTALRLAEAGIEAMMLEKGRRWELRPDGNTFSPYIYPDGRSRHRSIEEYPLVLGLAYRWQLNHDIGPGQRWTCYYPGLFTKTV